MSTAWTSFANGAGVTVDGGAAIAATTDSCVAMSTPTNARNISNLPECQRQTRILAVGGQLATSLSGTISDALRYCWRWRSCGSCVAQLQHYIDGVNRGSAMNIE